MKVPFNSIEVSNKFIRPFHVSFDIVFFDDIIQVKFLFDGKFCWVDYKSSKYESGMCSLENVPGD